MAVLCFVPCEWSIALVLTSCLRFGTMVCFLIVIFIVTLYRILYLYADKHVVNAWLVTMSITKHF